MTRACPLCHSPAPPEALFCLACGAALEATESAEGAADGVPAFDGFGPLPSGTLIRDETLVLVQVLGQGGFGITYLAREFSSGRSVAVKELFPFGCVRQNGSVIPTSLLDESAWQAAREGFRREGALLTGHAHPNVVQVLDVWDERGTTFLAMDYLDGQTLAQVLEEKGTLSVRRVRAMIKQVGGALALLHQAGMVHRDIKPENIMLCRTERAASPSTSPGAPMTTGAADRWVLLDFGAARAFAAGRSQSLTQIVTPGYAPLEQYASRARGGPPSDIYAFAATAYHALTGIAPPPATERASHDELRAPEAINPNIPHALSQSIVRALALRVGERPQTVEAWLRDMDGAPAAAPEVPKSPFAPSVAPPPLMAAPLAVAAPPIPAQAAAPVASGPSTWAGTSGPPADSRNELGFYGASEPAWSQRTAEAEPEMEEVLHGNVWFRVSVNARRIVWPKKCACCGGGTSLPLDVRTPAIWWQLPYCAACREHAERAESITVVANIVALLALALGTTFLLLDAVEPWALLWLVAGAVKAGALLLQASLLQVQKASAGTHCCSYVPAGRFKKQDGDTFVWEFRSRAFAEEFCALNGGDVRLPSASPGSPGSGPKLRERGRVPS